MLDRLFTFVTLSLALTFGAAAAQPAATLQSADCEGALRSLQAQEDVAASAPDAGQRANGRRRPPDARLLSLRRQAAQICLAGRADLPLPQRLVQPPVAVPPVATPQPAAPLALPPVPAEPPAAATQRSAVPTVITFCDPAGCWASDGSRLNRMGQNLLGPRGLCTVQGNLLHCP